MAQTASRAQWQVITVDLSPEGRLRALFDELEAEVIEKYGPEEWDRRVEAALSVKLPADHWPTRHNYGCARDGEPLDGYCGYCTPIR